MVSTVQPWPKLLGPVTQLVVGETTNQRWALDLSWVTVVVLLIH